MSNNGDAERITYLKETNVHHLFELLASRVLSNRPQDVFSFLRKQLDDIESEERKANASYSLSNSSNLKGPSPPPPKQQQQQHQQQSSSSSPSTSSPVVPHHQGTMKLNLAVFGLDNAGKTALIHAIGGQPNSKTTPTVGFSPTFFETDTADVAMFDLGGGASFRSIWKHYFHDVHGILYVVDGSDEGRLNEARTALQELLSHPYIAEKPVLLYVNKKDRAGAFLGADVVAQRLLSNISHASSSTHDTNAKNHIKVLPVCALEGEDPAIEQGIEWLLQTVKDRFDTLSSLVSKHSAEVKEQKKRDLEEQQKRVEAARAAEAAAAAAGGKD